MAVSSTLPTRDVQSVRFDPINPMTIYAMSERSGIFKSTDGGRKWMAITSGFADLSIHDLAVDFADPTTLYVGTFKRGVFKSTNGGENWQPTGSK